MRRYAYEGVLLGGQSAQGELEALNVAEVKRVMLRRGVAVRRVRRVRMMEHASTRTKLSLDALAKMTRHFSVMLSAGLPLVEALHLVAQGARKARERALLSDLAQQVSTGKSVAEAMRCHPASFSPIYLALVHAGEQSGTFDVMLSRIAQTLERNLALRAKMRKALVYPCIVMLVAILVMAVMLIFVVPMMESVFQGFGAELPVFTRLVLDLSDAFARRWWVFALTILVLAVMFRWLAGRFDRFALLVDRLLLKLPIAGKLIRESSMARFCETLATSFAAGTPFIEALTMLAPSARNRVLSQAILAVRDRVSAGELLHQAMHKSGGFPSLVIQMVRIGEESGELDTMLLRAAKHYSDSVDELAEALSEALGPVVMMVLAVLVGGLLIAMYMPIFSLGGALDG